MGQQYMRRGLLSPLGDQHGLTLGVVEDLPVVRDRLVKAKKVRCGSVEPPPDIDLRHTVPAQPHTPVDACDRQVRLVANPACSWGASMLPFLAFALLALQIALFVLQLLQKLCRHSPPIEGAAARSRDTGVRIPDRVQLLTNHGIRAGHQPATKGRDANQHTRIPKALTRRRVLIEAGGKAFRERLKPPELILRRWPLMMPPVHLRDRLCPAGNPQQMRMIQDVYRGKDTTSVPDQNQRTDGKRAWRSGAATNRPRRRHRRLKQPE